MEECPLEIILAIFSEIPLCDLILRMISKKYLTFAKLLFTNKVLRSKVIKGDIAKTVTKSQRKRFAFKGIEKSGILTSYLFESSTTNTKLRYFAIKPPCKNSNLYGILMNVHGELIVDPRIHYDILKQRVLEFHLDVSDERLKTIVFEIYLSQFVHGRLICYDFSWIRLVMDVLEITPKFEPLSDNINYNKSCNAIKEALNNL
jgi:hypothetical protein